MRRAFITGHLHGQKYRAAIVDFLIKTQLSSASSTAVFDLCRTPSTQYRTVLPLV